MEKRRIAVFGTGALYQKRKKKLNSIKNIEICAFIDNNETLWGKNLDGAPIMSPQELDSIQWDFIVLISIYATEMYDQLIGLGIEKKRILYWEEFNANFSGEKRTYCAKTLQNTGSRENILVLTTEMDYNGGTMAAIYAAECLYNRGYKVDMVTADGNSELICEVNDYGIDVILYDALPYIYEEEWIKKYDAVLVNVLQMIQCACEISKYRPVLWWIHEPTTLYNTTLKQFSEYADMQAMQYANIYAVSDIAKKNFNKYFPHRITKVLNYGILDVHSFNKRGNNKIVFAIIGPVCKLKAQDIFLKAAGKMKDKRAEFWIIGAMGNDAYSSYIKDSAEKNKSVKIKGVLSRKEIYEKYQDIDVVVCPSREDTLSIVTTEAMMFQKLCIVSNRVGMASYIEDGINGFVFDVDDVDMLFTKMQWVMENVDQVKEIKDRARETYRQFFSMEVFERNVEKAMVETMKQWKQQ